MNNVLVVLWLLMWSATPTPATAQQVSIGIGFPNVSIGINLPLYPQLVPVPGYPVYYAPQLNSNYFFYDGMYWVYQDDNWYASSWYNGPWGMVGPQFVPVFILRVPVRYYRQPPMYFRGWRSEAPPRWGEHWGRDWEQRRSGWDRWNRSSVPAPAPLPVYQRQYSGDRYPRVEQQQALHSQNYQYQPRDPVVRKQYEAQRAQSAPVSTQRGMQVTPQERNPGQRDTQRSQPPQSVQENAPNIRGPQRPQQEGQPAQQQTQQPRQEPAQGQQAQQKAAKREQPRQEPAQRQQPVQQQPARRQQQPAQEQQPAPKSQGKEAQQQPKRGKGQGQAGQEKDKEKEKGNNSGQDDSGQDRNNERP